METPNIVLVVVDTLRAKNLECYGCKEETSPFLSRMAAEHTKIDPFYANAPWTIPAHASLFTGDLPSSHGCTTEHLRFDCDNILVTAVKQQGYRAVGISENRLISEQIGFDSGFDAFYSLSSGKDGEVWTEIQNQDAMFDSAVEKWATFLGRAVKRRDITSLYSFYRRVFEKAVFDRFEEDINPQGSQYTLTKIQEEFDNIEKGLFLFVNLMPVHAPYTFNKEQRDQFLSDVPDSDLTELSGIAAVLEDVDVDEYSLEEIQEYREAAYNAAIRYADGLLEEIWEKAPDDTVFVVVGDHGELIGEYTVAGFRPSDHHFGTFKELIRVPCILFPDFDISVPEGVFDQGGLHYLLRALAGESVEIGSKDTVIAEYSGKAAMHRHFNKAIPDERKDLFERTSNSIITIDWKYDITSDGEYLWETDTMIEEENKIVEESGVVQNLRYILREKQIQDVINGIDI